MTPRATGRGRLAADLSGANGGTTSALLDLHLVAATVMIPVLALRLRAPEG